MYKSVKCIKREMFKYQGNRFDSYRIRSMEAHGTDGILAVNENFITITWKSLRGRLGSSHGAPTEVVPLNRIFDIFLIPATASRKGCVQIQLIGSSSNLKSEHNWVETLRDKKINQTIMFNLQNQFEFNAVVKFVERRISLLRTQTNYDPEGREFASGA